MVSIKSTVIPRTEETLFGLDYSSSVSVAAAGNSMSILGKILQIEYWVKESASEERNAAIKDIISELKSEKIFEQNDRLLRGLDLPINTISDWIYLKAEILSSLPIGPGAIQTDLLSEVACINCSKLPPSLKAQIGLIHTERMKKYDGEGLGFSSTWGPENSIDFLEKKFTTTIVAIDTSKNEWKVQGYMILLENPPHEVLSDKVWEALSNLDESLKVDLSRSTTNIDQKDPLRENFGSILADGFYWLQAVAVSKVFAADYFQRTHSSLYKKMISGLNAYCAYHQNQSILVGHCPVGLDGNTAAPKHAEVGCYYDGTIIHRDTDLSVMHTFKPKEERGLAIFWTVIGNN
jgi:hypothetical protein